MNVPPAGVAVAASLASTSATTSLDIVKLLTACRTSG